MPEVNAAAASGAGSPPGSTVADGDAGLGQRLEEDLLAVRAAVHRDLLAHQSATVRIPLSAGATMPAPAASAGIADREILNFETVRSAPDDRADRRRKG